MSVKDAAPQQDLSLDNDIDRFSDLLEDLLPEPELAPEVPEILLSVPGRPWSALGYAPCAGLLTSDDLPMKALNDDCEIDPEFKVRIARGMRADDMKTLMEDEGDSVPAGHRFLPDPFESDDCVRFSMVISNHNGEDIGYSTCKLTLMSQSIFDASGAEWEAMGVYGKPSDRDFERIEKVYEATYWSLCAELDYIFIDAQVRFEGAADSLIDAFVAVISGEVVKLRDALSVHGANANLAVNALAEPHGHGGQVMCLSFLESLVEEFGEDPDGECRDPHPFDAFEEAGSALATDIAHESRGKISDALRQIGVLFREERLAENDEGPLRVRLHDMIDW